MRVSESLCESFRTANQGEYYVEYASHTNQQRTCSHVTFVPCSLFETLSITTWVIRCSRINLLLWKKACSSDRGHRPAVAVGPM